MSLHLCLQLSILNFVFRILSALFAMTLSQRQIVTVKFILWTEFSLCVYLETFQERRLDFPKCAYFSKSVAMVTRGEPLKKETQF